MRRSSVVLTRVSDREKVDERVLLLSPVLLIEIKEQHMSLVPTISHRCPFGLFHKVLHNSLGGHLRCHYV